MEEEEEEEEEEEGNENCGGGHRGCDEKTSILLSQRN